MLDCQFGRQVNKSLAPSLINKVKNLYSWTMIHMHIPIGQWLENVTDYFSAQISLFAKWHESESGIKARKWSVYSTKIIFIASVYYVIFMFCKFVFSVAPTPKDGSKFILAVCGIVAFIWAWGKINILGKKLLKKIRAAKREKIDIPFRLWYRDTIAYIKQTKIVTSYREMLKSLTKINELIANKLFIWTFHSILEPELNWHSQKDFFSVGELPSELKELHGEKVGKRYVNFGFLVALIWAMITFFIALLLSMPINKLILFVVGLFGEIAQGIASEIINFFILLFTFSVMGTSFWGSLIAFNKRTALWWTPPTITQQEPQQEAYQELKEHLSHKMDELSTATEQVDSVDKQLIQRKQALAELREIEPELAGHVGVLVNMVVEEINAKAEISERRRAKTDLLKEIIIGAIFFVLGLLITSDVIKSLFDKIVTIVKS